MRPQSRRGTREGTHRSAHHVETLAKHYRQQTEREKLSREALQHTNRSLTYWYDYDGSLVIKGRLPASGGAMLVKAIEAAVVEINVKHVSAETPWKGPGFAARRADAVTLVAKQFLEGGSHSSTELVVHVDERTLREKCVGRKTRTLPPSSKRALNSRDRGCRFQGCPNKRYVDVGETKLSNLVTLCHFHHRRVHEGNVKVQVLDNGAIRFTQPNGESLEAPGLSPTDWTNLVALNRENGVYIDKETAATRWTGERMDYSTALMCLGQMRRRRDVSAGTPVRNV